MNQRETEILDRFIGSIQPLAVPRMEDLPYWTSPPIQFVYESTATLNLGVYTWNDQLSPQALTPARPILGNVLYYFRHVSFSADIEELDFTANITAIPQFQMYRTQDALAPFFRESIQMTQFLSNWDFRQVWLSSRSKEDRETVADALRGSFTGSLIQGPGLVGKASITLRAVISAQEISDSRYVNLFKAPYPASMREGDRRR